MARLEDTKAQTQEEIDEMEQGLEELKEDVKTSNAVLEERNETLDKVKRSTMKATKVLDQALKEIATKVRPATSPGE